MIRHMASLFLYQYAKNRNGIASAAVSLTIRHGKTHIIINSPIFYKQSFCQCKIHIALFLVLRIVNCTKNEKNDFRIRRRPIFSYCGQSDGSALPDRRPNNSFHIYPETKSMLKNTPIFFRLSLDKEKVIAYNMASVTETVHRCDRVCGGYSSVG